jgi:hypothetical protein
MTDVIRIPNLPMGHIVEQDGMPTDDELTFRQVLVTNLQRLFGNEGVVLPSLAYADIVSIVNAYQNIGGTQRYTCAPGTLFHSTYDPLEPMSNKILATIQDPLNLSGPPLLKEVNLI